MDFTCTIKNAVRSQNTYVYLNLKIIQKNFYFFQVVGLYSNILLNFLLNDGYQLIFNETYQHATSNDDIILYNSYCSTKTVLCLGGGELGLNSIRIVACARCKDILISTAINNPTYLGSAWWYYTTSTSIGYSPVNVINQQAGDIQDQPNEFRLSWELGGVISGFRAGSLNAYNHDLSLLIKYVFVKHRKLI